MESVEKQPTFLQKLNDIRYIAVLVVLAMLALLAYEIISDANDKSDIADAANEFGAVIEECLSEKTKLECLVLLKQVADKETFEAVKSLSIQN